jgi:hypothetical protein
MPNLDLPAVAEHRPYEAQYRMAMGLTSVAEPDWLEFGDDYQAQMKERKRLLCARRNDVLACQAVAEAAAAELLETLAQHLCTHHPAWFSRTARTIHNHLLNKTIGLDDDNPLAIAGRLVQEDFCLNQLHPDGHRLTAAILCFPTRWSLAEKLGKPLIEVHEHVPDFADRLGTPVERFFTNLKPGRLAQRLNWSILDDDALFQVTGKGRIDLDDRICTENALQRLFLRVERQSFRRLPKSQAVVFGIRIHQTRLDRVVTEPGEAARLSAALRALPDDMARYKSVFRFSAALQAALARL